MSGLVLVAVPGGALRGGRPVLRVVVVPQLGEEGGRPGSLRDHQLSDWPALLASSTLTVQVAPDPGAGPQTVDSTWNGPPPAELSELWRTCFPADLPVEPWRRQRSFDPPYVSPTADQAGQVSACYRQVAVAGESERPAAVRARLAELGRGLAASDRARRERVRAAAGRASDDRAGRRSSPGEPYDFHRSVTMLRDHPAVLRALGLIVDLVLDPDLPPAPAGRPWVVRVHGEVPGLETVSPWTRYQFDGHRFLPAPGSGSDLTGGLLDLAAPGRWEIDTFDVDGAVGRLRDELRTLREAEPGTEPSTLPALRSAGLLLVRRDRDSEFEARLAVARRNAGQPLSQVELTADELVLGYRLDIIAQDGSAFSLCQRLARYFANGQLIGAQSAQSAQSAQPELEEGHLKPNAVAWDEAGQDLAADEVVARWDGWSVALPRPLASPVGNGGGGTRRFSLLPFDFSWEHRGPEPSANHADDPANGHRDGQHRLPALRFGRSYRMRVRVADIAGGGLGLDDPDAGEGESGLVTYRRFEPVPPPQLPPPPGLVQTGQPGQPGQPRVAPDALGPGGAVDRLVVRSDPNHAEQLGSAPFAARYPANDRRELLPPPGSVALAEQHGMFDGVDPEVSWGWVRDVIAGDDPEAWLPDPGGAAWQCCCPCPGIRCTAAGT